jgi:hypothetical protein
MKWTSNVRGSTSDVYSFPFTVMVKVTLLGATMVSAIPRLAPFFIQPRAAPSRHEKIADGG